MSKRKFSKAWKIQKLFDHISLSATKKKSFWNFAKGSLRKYIIKLALFNVCINFYYLLNIGIPRKKDNILCTQEKNEKKYWDPFIGFLSIYLYNRKSKRASLWCPIINKSWILFLQKKTINIPKVWFRLSCILCVIQQPSFENP